MKYLLENTREFYRSCQIAAMNGEKTMDGDRVLDFKDLNSEIMNKLSISIINLMGFFGRNTNSMRPIKKLCKEICIQMDNLDRDQDLLNCLKLTSRDVKLSVVKCNITSLLTK